MTVAVGRLEAAGPKPREVWLTFGMSVVLHGVLVGAIVLIPHFRVGTYITVPVSYTVSLVSAPPGGRSSAGPAPTPPPAALKPAPLAPAPQAAPAPPAAKPTEELTLPGRQAPRRPTKEVEPSLRPPTQAPRETPRSVRPSVAPPAPAAPAVTAPPAPVAAPPAAVASVQTDTGAGTGKASGIELAAKPSKGEGGTALGMYLGLLDWKIDTSWVRVPVAGAPELAVVVRFRVLPSGQVREVELDASSGNGAVDAAALRAIRQTMPPFPNLLTEPYLDLRYRFVLERE